MQCTQTDKHFTTTAYQCQGQRQTGGQTWSSLQDQMLWLPGHLIMMVRTAETLAGDWLNTKERREMVLQQSHCWAPFTNETWYRLTGTLWHAKHILQTHFRKLVYQLRTNTIESQSTITSTVQTTYWQTRTTLTTTEWLITYNLTNI